MPPNRGGRKVGRFSSDIGQTRPDVPALVRDHEAFRAGLYSSDPRCHEPLGLPDRCRVLGSMRRDKLLPRMRMWFRARRTISLERSLQKVRNTIQQLARGRHIVRVG